MFRNDRDESFQTTEDSSVYHYGPTWSLFGTLVIISTSILEVEPFRQLEVELYRCALEPSSQRILYGDVNFRTIERAVAGIEVPLSRVELIQRFRELL